MRVTMSATSTGNWSWRKTIGLKLQTLYFPSLSPSLSISSLGYKNSSSIDCSRCWLFNHFHCFTSQIRFSSPSHSLPQQTFSVIVFFLYSLSLSHWLFNETLFRVLCLASLAISLPSSSLSLFFWLMGFRFSMQIWVRICMALITHTPFSLFQTSIVSWLLNFHHSLSIFLILSSQFFLLFMNQKNQRKSERTTKNGIGFDLWIMNHQASFSILLIFLSFSLLIFTPFLGRVEETPLRQECESLRQYSKKRELKWALNECHSIAIKISAFSHTHFCWISPSLSPSLSVFIQ